MHLNAEPVGGFGSVVVGNRLWVGDRQAPPTIILAERSTFLFTRLSTYTSAVYLIFQTSASELLLGSPTDISWPVGKYTERSGLHLKKNEQNGQLSANVRTIETVNGMERLWREVACTVM